MTDGPSPAEMLAPPSPRSTRQRLIFVTLAGTLAIIGTLAAGYYFAMRPVTLRIAVGPANSGDLRVVQTLTRAFNNEQRSQVHLRLVQTDGALASARLLGENEADLAVIRGDLEVPKNAQAVAILRKNVVVLWVPPAGKDKDAALAVTKIAQLAGLHVGVIGRTPANVNLLKVILRQYGVDPGKVEITQFPVNEIAEAIRHKKADAYLAAGPVNSKITADAIAASTRDGGTPKFLAIDLADAIAQSHPVYEASGIPAGTFGAAPDKPDEEVKTISFSHHIVARKSISESTIAAFTRQLFAIRQNLKTEFPLAAKIETPDTDKDATIPVHPGAAAFVDGEEKTFLDRYSDYIWWGLMALSAMGSAGAWFAGHLRKDERNVNISQRDRLLDMLTAARRCDSMDELDDMQAEADAILRDTLLCFEHGTIAEGTLTAFNIAIEQFHNAVADRKTLLMSMPQSMQRPSAKLRTAGTA